MSEKFEQPYDEMPKMLLDVGGSEFEATPENTTLFTFLGRIACYSHVFVQTGDQNEKVMIGTYVFANHQAYEPMVEYMVENAYPMHNNLREVAECDVAAYDRMISQASADIDDFFPEDWQ